MSGLKLSHALASLALGAALVAVTTPAVRADDNRGRNRCQQQTERAQQKYQEEAREHGRHSPQAENARARLNSIWDRCYEEVHAWYDPHSQHWRNDRDWDRNYDWDRDGDRDRDRDHDRDRDRDRDRDNH
jgi:hypothetical protein